MRSKPPNSGPRNRRTVPIDSLAKFWEELDRLPLLTSEAKYLADMRSHGMDGEAFLALSRDQESERSDSGTSWIRLLAITHNAVERHDRELLRRCFDIAERALEAGVKEVVEMAFVSVAEDIRFSGSPEEHLSFAALMGPKLRELNCIMNPEVAPHWSPP
jgi:hypothetical protein